MEKKFPGHVAMAIWTSSKTAEPKSISKWLPCLFRENVVYSKEMKLMVFQLWTSSITTFPVDNALTFPLLRGGQSALVTFHVDRASLSIVLTQRDQWKKRKRLDGLHLNDVARQTSGWILTIVPCDLFTPHTQTQSPWFITIIEPGITVIRRVSFQITTYHTQFYSLFCGGH